MKPAKTPGLPAPATPALAGPPVVAPEGKMMLRVLDQRCHWAPAGR